MGNEIKLETKFVGDIKNVFEVPSYQRGYRWTSNEVKRLLDDVYKNGANNYCLQPIVVQDNGEKHVVIDGQQRLTTIYLIYKYMNESSNGFISKAKFSIFYTTRDKTKEYLESIEKDRANENIDFYYIYYAYKAIEEWFDDFKDKKASAITDINNFFDKYVKVIWYEIKNDEAEAIELFKRLNIGKIPLTSSELVKAMFLKSDSEEKLKNRAEEIALQWDDIERELHNESFWKFLSNKNDYQTRIDIVLDLISGKQAFEREKYFTFFYFEKQNEEKKLEEIWTNIHHTFLLLKDWFEDREFYHKIGYLVASDSNSLKEIYELSKEKKKSEFKSELDKKISESIGDVIDDMSYENNYQKIYKLLFLFNVFSVYNIDDESQRFPFDRFKNTNWSIEHIHAQQSENLTKQEDWKEWLRLHIQSLKSLENDTNINDLVEKMEDFSSSEYKLTRDEFSSISKIVVEKLSSENNLGDIHSIGNLALLDIKDNAALSNSTFDVKRNEIIERDKTGSYIPYCTKMCFLKYYSKSQNTQIHFWGIEDRISYIGAINDILFEKFHFLNELIETEKQLED